MVLDRAVAADARSAQDGIRPAAPRRYFILIILMIAYACAYLDRSIIAVVLPQLRQEFHIGDVGLGFLSGLAFTAFFVLFGLPMAVLADRYNRRNIIAAAIALWSVMTALCGFAGNFVQLALARLGVGVGESGLTPPAHSMISDMFPARQRGLALSIYSIGIYIGIIIGLAWGGYLTQRYGWRIAFMVMGVPGLVVSAVIAFTVREPPRGASDERTLPDLKYRNFANTVHFLWSTQSLRYTLLAITLCSLFTQTQAAWLPSFLVRTHGLPIGRVGLILGLTGGIGGAIGTVAGGRLSDRLGARDPRWRLWIVSVAFLVLPVSALTLLYTSSVTAIICAAFVSAMMSAVHLAPTSAVTQNLTPQRMRARAVAVTLLLISLVGGGVGPLAIGALSQALRHAYGKNSLRYALTTLAAFALASAAAYFVAGLKMPRPLPGASGHDGSPTRDGVDDDLTAVGGLSPTAPLP